MEFTKAKRTVRKNDDEEIRRRLLNWPDVYYRERDPGIRKRLLDEADNQGLTPEENVIRRRLYELRYPQKGEVKDTFLRAWLEMRFLTDNNGGILFRGKDPAKVHKIMKSIGFDGNMGDRTYRQLLYMEIYHLGMLYGSLCTEDRNYSSRLLGFGSLSEEKLALKIASEFRDIAADVPKSFGVAKEYEIWTQAILEAYTDLFPDYAYAVEADDE